MDLINKWSKFSRSYSNSFFFILVGIVFIAFGLFIKSASSDTSQYPSVDATIISISYADSESDMPEVMVKYTVDGKTYEAQAPSYTTGQQVGDIMTVQYNPEDPTALFTGGASVIGWVMLTIGVAALVWAFISIKKAKAKNEKLEAQEASFGQQTSFSQQSFFGQQPENASDFVFNQKYFFQFDKKMKQGHFMEDENYQKVYEAIMTKFNLALPFEFEFVNHRTGVTTKHSVGHTVTIEGGIASAQKSYFSYDGQKDVWDYLHDKGIRINTQIVDIMGKINYFVTLSGMPIGVIRTAGVKVHEETGFASKMIARGFYKVETNDDYLDDIFLVTMAIARTEQTTYD